SLPVLELDGSDSVPDPLVDLVHHSRRLRDSEIAAPAVQEARESVRRLFHAAAVVTARQLADALLQLAQGLLRHAHLDLAAGGHPEADAEEIALEGRRHR